MPFMVEGTQYYIVGVGVCMPLRMVKHQFLDIVPHHRDVHVTTLTSDLAIFHPRILVAETPANYKLNTLCSINVQLKHNILGVTLNPLISIVKTSPNISGR
uniref:Uncharacterized protein n=1 Tax=Cuerna arida TaxID=1464854 RepID=A0A1B6EJY1_9HEMI